MSRFRTFIQRHLVADDPAPGYSRLDRLGGLEEPPAVTAAPADSPKSTAAPTAPSVPAAVPRAPAVDAELAAIVERLRADEHEFTGDVADRSTRDRRYLLALVEQQRARLEQVEELAERLDRHGSQDRHYARQIRSALSLPGDDLGLRTPGT
ncbi:hypothetical protein ACTWLI_15370 [Arthrobacter sp. Hor0625]|uniref:hypothetical protein n=1 Tax=Arthrobacter sp. Hor0625 TaxID=3457358 RepID=UPI00403ECCB4